MKQQCSLANVNMLYNARKSIVKLFDDYTTIASEAKHRAIKGTGTEILMPKQMLQRLPIPIALAHVKAGNISDYFLNLTDCFCLY